MLTFDPSQIPFQETHRLLLGVIAPRPIAFVGSMDKEGRPNLSPFSFFNAFGVNPPVICFSPAFAGKTGKAKDTLLNILETKECTVSIITYDMVRQASLASAPFDRGVDDHHGTQERDEPQPPTRFPERVAPDDPDRRADEQRLDDEIQPQLDWEAGDQPPYPRVRPQSSRYVPAHESGAPVRPPPERAQHPMPYPGIRTLLDDSLHDVARRGWNRDQHFADSVLRDQSAQIADPAENGSARDS